MLTATGDPGGKWARASGANPRKRRAHRWASRLHRGYRFAFSAQRSTPRSPLISLATPYVGTVGRTQLGRSDLGRAPSCICGQRQAGGPALLLEAGGQLAGAAGRREGAARLSRPARAPERAALGHREQAEAKPFPRSCVPFAPTPRMTASHGASLMQGTEKGSCCGRSCRSVRLGLDTKPGSIRGQLCSRPHLRVRVKRKLRSGHIGVGKPRVSVLPHTHGTEDQSTLPSVPGCLPVPAVVGTHPACPGEDSGPPPGPHPASALQPSPS